MEGAVVTTLRGTGNGDGAILDGNDDVRVQGARKVSFRPLHRYLVALKGYLHLRGDWDRL
jgi:hypothetical protein